MALAILIVAAMLTLTHLGRRLPFQNVAAIAALTIGIAFISEVALKSVGLGTQLPAWLTSGSAIAKVDVTLPLLWLVFLLNIRMVIRELLFNFGYRDIGLWVLAMTVLITTAVWWIIEPNHDPQPGGLKALLRFTIAAATLLAAFPWMIDKKPQSGG
jgi:hypothetical protein